MYRIVSKLPQTYLRFALLASLAAGVAFGIGSLVTQVSAVVAAITALISVRPTFHNSIREALSQVLGTLIGAAIALGLVLILGDFTAVALMLVTLACFFLAKVLKLGEEGALTLAITVFLVAGFAMDIEAVEHRFFGVVVGVLCALLASLYISPGTPTQRIQDSVSKLGVRISTALETVAETIQSSTQKTTEESEQVAVENIVAELEDIRRELSLLYKEATEVVSGSRWSPLLSKQEAEDTVQQVERLESIAAHALNISLEFLSAQQSGNSFSTRVAGSLSAVIDIVADKVAERSQTGATRENALHDTEELEIIFEAKDLVRNLEDTRPLFLGTSILRNTEKIAEELESPENPIR